MRTQIAVEDVRRIAGFMTLTPAEGGWNLAVRNPRNGKPHLSGRVAA